MSRVRTLLLVVLAAAALLAFAWVLRQLSLLTLELAAHREVEQQLRQTLEDQKKLARLDPASSRRYRERFDAVAGLVGHLRVVQLNRAEVARQVERMLVGIVAAILGCGLGLYFIERRSRERRLVRLEAALAALSRGEQVALDDSRRDVIGRIADAIGRTSRAAAQDRRRLRYLENLSAWQEAARRHAHEIRTPLAAARMEAERLAAGDARASILEELDHLAEFTRNFTSFATIQKPRLRTLDLRQLVANFCATFATAWPGLQLCTTDTPVCRDVPVSPDRQECLSYMVSADGEMVRQVLANLAGNSALAHASAITFAVHRERDGVLLDVTDDGPGVPPEIVGRLFEPYTTTRVVGEGMGLGLAISRKIMLDHGGDLDLVANEAGATFRLTFPALETT